MSPRGCRGPSYSLTSGQSRTGRGCQGLRIHRTCQGGCGVSGASPWQHGRHPGIRCSPAWEEDVRPVSQTLLGSNRLGVSPGKMDLRAAGLSLPLDSRGTGLGGLCLENDSEGPRCAPLAKATPSVSHGAGMTQREPQAPGRGSAVCPPCLGKPRVPGMLLRSASFGDKGVRQGPTRVLWGISAPVSFWMGIIHRDDQRIFPGNPVPECVGMWGSRTRPQAVWGPLCHSGAPLGGDMPTEQCGADPRPLLGWALLGAHLVRSPAAYGAL